jgi:ABC-type branched-subunit amino acid transport system substrate-binding protein
MIDVTENRKLAVPAAKHAAAKRGRVLWSGPFQQSHETGRTTMGIEVRTIGLRLGVIGVGLLLLCAFASSPMAADLKIGFTFSLTGGTDDAGKGARMGAELALAEYNERGGYKGQKVEAIIYDDETKPAKGVENVTRLITRDKVFAIVGPVNSGVALAGRTSCRRPRPFSSNDDGRD